MFAITTAEQDQFDFNFEHDETGRVTSIWNDDGNEVRVSRHVYAQMCQYAKEVIAGTAYHLDGMKAEARW